MRDNLVTQTNLVYNNSVSRTKGVNEYGSKRIK